MGFYEFIILIIAFGVAEWAFKPFRPVILFLAGLLAFQKNLLQIETAMTVLSIVLVYEFFRRALSTSFPIIFKTQRRALSIAARGLLLQIGLGLIAAKFLLTGLNWMGALLLILLITPTELPAKKLPPTLGGALHIEALFSSLFAPFLVIPCTYSLYLWQGKAPVIAYGQMLFVQVLGALFLGGLFFYLARRFNKRSLFLLPFLLYIVSTQLGMNGFIPVILCGFLVGYYKRSHGIDLLRQGRREGRFLILLPFFFLAPPVIEWGSKLWVSSNIVFALTYLLPVRFVAIWIATRGSGWSNTMRLYLCFAVEKSPIAVALLYIIGVAHAPALFPLGLVTLVVSIGISQLGGWLVKCPPEDAERDPVFELCR